MSEKFQDFRQWVAQEKGKTEKVEKKIHLALDVIPKGCKFEPNLEGVVEVTIMPPDEKKAKTVQVILFFHGQNGKEEHETFFLTNEGKINGKIPKELRHLTREAITIEILRNLELIQPEFWSEIKTSILPEGDGIPLGPRQEKKEIPKREREQIDPKRLEHIRQKGARFGGLEKIGLSGYHVFVFDGFMVLENERIYNAAYVIAIPEGTVIPTANSPKEDRDAFFALPEIIQLLSQTKQQLIADKDRTIRVIHSKGWEERLDGIIEEQSVERRRSA